MADYIYLLENRLSSAQKFALDAVRGLARSKGLTVFLVGGAVRDLTSGAPVADLDVVVQGNALKLKKELASIGATLAGENEAGQSLFVRFAGSVRMEIGSTLTVTFPKPGKPVYKPGTILEDLRRRDFTANAMALSLNEGSYGLLMDPLNGVADIESRQLRLVSNYGFIEDPIRMVRAARLLARLGWTLEEKTQTRYETGKNEGYISAMQEFSRGYELEEIVHEEDPLRVLRALEAEGWMALLAPFWTAAKANEAELTKLREAQTLLQMQGIHPDAASAHFPLLTAKLNAKEIGELKHSFPRQGFVAEIEALESEAKEFATQLTSKASAAPSAAYKLITSSSPEAVLWAAYSSKSSALQAKFKSFFTEWPQVRQKIPFALLQEMRIVPELPIYGELLEKLFFELMDGKLGTVEEMKAFLEPYSPPAPPPPVSMRRARASKKDAKVPKARGRKALAKLDEGDEDAVDVDVDDEDEDEDEDAIELPPVPDDEEIPDLDEDDDEVEADDDEDEDDSDDDEDEPVKPKKASAKSAPVKAPAKAAKAPAPAPHAPVKAVKAAPASAKAAPVKAAPAKAAPAKAAPVKSAPPKAVKAPAKVAVKAASKPVVKSAGMRQGAQTKAKIAPRKPAPAKKVVPVAKKVVPAKKAAPSKPAPVVKKAVKAPAKAAKPAPKPVAKKAVPAKAKGKAAPPVKGKKR